MSGASWIQLAVLVGIILAVTPILGRYIAGVFTSEHDWRAERWIYRICGVNSQREQGWATYARSVLAFSLVSVLGLYLLQRAQGALFLNPTDMVGVPPTLAWNTAVSFVTNTNWQNYGGESTMSHLTQMVGLSVQNFASAAVGLAVAIALIRGLVRRGSSTIGNFWVDLTRGITRLLLPIAFIAALVLAGFGVVQNLGGGTIAKTLGGVSQFIPGGPVASQEAIKELGTNGGGFFNANSAHPFENPTGFTNLIQLVLILVIPFALAHTFGRMAKDRKQGWAVFAAMFLLWAGSAVVASAFEANGNPELERSAQVSGPNMEGKEVRFGAETSGLYAATTTGTSTGAVISSHDSFTPAGGAVPLVNMMLGEVSPGGVGAGLYGILVFALLAVFIAGLMVGRTPEFLGKKIQATEMKLATIYILIAPIAILIFSGISVVMGTALASRLNTGPHGLTEITYAFTSAANNNGSAFGGLTGNTNWYNTTLGIAMLVGRFFLIVPVLGIAGSLARKKAIAAGAGTLPTNTPLFAGLLVGVIVIVVGLTFFPVLALGPLVEQLSL